MCRCTTPKRSPRRCEQAGREYDLTIYADEGHRYARPQNVVDCRAQCLEFLLTNLRASADEVSLG